MPQDEISSLTNSTLPDSEEQTVIPVIREELEISKRTIETGTVRLQKHTEEHIETVEVPLTRVQWQVEHVPINEVVTEPPQIRYEGETTVYPVVEERLVVVREMVLVEEVRVTRKAVTTAEVSSYVLRRERISDERVQSS